MHSHLLIFLFFLRLKGFTAWGPHQNTAATCRPWNIKGLPEWVWEPKSTRCWSCSFCGQQDLHVPGLLAHLCSCWMWFCGEFTVLLASTGSQTAIFAWTPHKEPWYAALTRANTNTMSVLHHNTWVRSSKPKQLNSHHPLARGVSWSPKSKEHGL